ncbi:MAG: hypothetical protein LBH59_09225 [Planctomycetaceae bacterium]|jgi:hypothetical protein|nr:hypothetical protein [Planctomycetaceae bacterium]
MTSQNFNLFQSWSDRERYYEDVCRTLIQTGDVFVCREDIFAIKQRLKDFGIDWVSLNILSDSGGWFLSIEDHQSKYGTKFTNTTRFIGTK